MASEEVWATLPKTTWSTRSGEIPACASAARAAWTPRSVAERSLSEPPYVPNGVLLAARKTTSVEVAERMGAPSGGDLSRTAQQDVHGRSEEERRERGDGEGERRRAAELAPPIAGVPGAGGGHPRVELERHRRRAVPGREALDRDLVRGELPLRRRASDRPHLGIQVGPRRSSVTVGEDVRTVREGAVKDEPRRPRRAALLEDVRIGPA